MTETSKKHTSELDYPDPFERIQKDTLNRDGLIDLLRFLYAKPLHTQTQLTRPAWIEITNAVPHGSIHIAADRRFGNLAFALPPQDGPIFDTVGVYADPSTPLSF